MARIAKIVLIGAVTPFLLKADDNLDGVDPSVFDEMLEQIQADRADFLAAFGKKFYGVNLLRHPVSDSHLKRDQMLALLGSPRATLECIKAFSGTDFRSDLTAVTVPTLIVHGSSDQTVPFEASGQKTHALIPQSQLLVYEEGPHGLFFTHKDQLNKDLLSFILTNSPVTETAY